MSVLTQAKQWPAVVAALPLKGLLKAFADQTAWQSWNAPDLVLAVPQDQEALNTEQRSQNLGQELSRLLGAPVRVTVVLAQEAQGNTLKAKETQQRSEQKEAFTQVLQKDEPLQSLVRAFDAKLTEVTPQNNTEASR